MGMRNRQRQGKFSRRSFSRKGLGLARNCFGFNCETSCLPECLSPKKVPVTYQRQTKTFTDLLTDDFGRFGGPSITFADKLADGVFVNYEINSKGLKDIEVLKDGTKIFEIDGSS